MDAATRVLVLANRTADSTQLRQQLLARHGQGRIAVTTSTTAMDSEAASDDVCGPLVAITSRGRR
jgi:hypothetical protein